MTTEPQFVMVPRPALDETVKLLRHYSELLNQYDDGLRTIPETWDAWLDRLRLTVPDVAAATAAAPPSPPTTDRDPTEAMLGAARDWSAAKYGKPIGSEAAIGCWQAMYDAREKWRCKANPTADPPQDCGWPTCGCDPYADKVLAALEEGGIATPQSPREKPLEAALREARRLLVDYVPDDESNVVAPCVARIDSALATPPSAQGWQTMEGAP